MTPPPSDAQRIAAQLQLAADRGKLSADNGNYLCGVTINLAEQAAVEIARLASQLAGVREALNGLRTNCYDPKDEPCWCGISVGMGDQHADYCLDARAAIVATQARARETETG